MSSEDFVEASGDQVARPQLEAVGPASLLEEIRFRIWHNTGCSDDAAEGAAAAVYDLFLDQKAAAPDLLQCVRDLKECFRFALLSTTPEIARDGMAFIRAAEAAIAKAEGRS